MTPSNGLNKGWKAVLERFWSRTGLGQLPSGDRFSFWLLTIDGIEIRIAPTPDELGLFIRSRIAVLRRDDKDYFSTVGRIMRRNLGYMIGEIASVRLMPGASNADTLVGETVFDPMRQSEDDLDEMISNLVERSVIYRRDFASSGTGTAFGKVTIASKPQETYEPEMIFRP